MFVHIALNAGSRELDFPLTYRAPEGRVPEVGMCAVVPLRSREESGYVLAVTAGPELPEDLNIGGDNAFLGEVRTLTELLEIPPLFDRATASLLCWIARQYVCGISDALRCIVPPYRLASSSTRVQLPAETNPGARSPALALPPDSGSPPEVRLLDTIAAAGGAVLLADLEKGLGKSLGAPRLKDLIRRLARRGSLHLVHDWRRPSEGREVHGVRLAVAGPELETWLEKSGRARGQRLVVEILQSRDGRPVPQADLLREAGVTGAPLKALLKLRIVERVTINVRRSPWPTPAQVPLDFSLTENQTTAIERIRAVLNRASAAGDEVAASAAPEPGEVGQSLRRRRAPAVLLLRGVTGSGKTEVYLRAIEAVLQRGRQAISLVPEISLTAQMVGIFQGRFGDRVAVLHSKLSEGERLDEWQRIRRGEVDVVLGARSALFAPVPRLGLIVVDEEHETSYKQDSSPRYVTRDAAMERARLAGAAVLLGSATPSLEAMWLADRGAAEEIVLPHRIDHRPLPTVVLVDQRVEMKENPGHLFSRRLQGEVESRLARGEQTILFLNRRGFATITLCRECGFVARCRNCAVSLTYYASTRTLRCHHCNFTRPAPDTCPSCRGTRILQFGVGTERVERELAILFPEARIGRMDAAAMSRKGAAQALVEQFRRHELDILVGTQMLAKGFDFPKVTLVGVISADTMLNLPDFRAAERTFQLLTQVSGRAGRGLIPGEVIVQTFNPEHYAIQAAARHDFGAFYEQELPVRREARYPPFVRLANIVVESSDGAGARAVAERVARALRQILVNQEVDLLGPAPAPLSRLKGRFRWHLLLKSEDPSVLRDAGRQLRAALRPDDRSQLTLDIDPMSLL